ncbi:MAG: dihydropteroate synthase [Verrucomicrobiota bacterium]
MIWRSRLREYAPVPHAVVMGILNITPDSFSDGGQHDNGESALRHARQMIVEGAEIIDIGGESTRPGAEPVSQDEEIRRVVPIIQALRAEWDGGISIDTTKAGVADAALAAGADIVNDISGLLADPEMPALCAAAGCAVVVMHMQGQPRTMQDAPEYADVVADVRGFFRARFEALLDAGVHAEAMCFDPGIGFGKTLDHNLALLAAIDTLAPPNRPLLLGVSRKSFLGKLLGDLPPVERDRATAVVTCLARAKGVMFHRVHDVGGNLGALRVAEAILRGSDEIS